MAQDRIVRLLGAQSGSPSLAEAREAAMRAESHIVPLSSGELHLIDEGRAGQLPAVVILSAQWLAATSFDQVARELSNRTRIIRVDLPGHGLASPFADEDYSGAGYARVVGELLDDLALDSFVLVGQSHSGIPATAIAAEGRRGLAGLVLATTSGLPRGGAAPPGTTAPGEEIPLHRPLFFYRDKLAALLRREHSPVLIERLATEMKLFNELPGRESETTKRARRYDPGMLGSFLPRVQLPALVLWSTDSTYLPASMADTVAGLLPICAGSEILPQTGHLLLADAPADAAARMLAFMKRWA